MRHLLLIISVILITLTAESQETEPFQTVVEDDEFHSSSPEPDNETITVNLSDEVELRTDPTTDKKEEIPVNEEELNDSDKGMAGIFRVVGLACVTLVGCLIGVGGTIWLCIKGKKAIEQNAN